MMHALDNIDDVIMNTLIIKQTGTMEVCYGHALENFWHAWSVILIV